MSDACAIYLQWLTFKMDEGMIVHAYFDCQVAKTIETIAGKPVEVMKINKLWLRSHSDAAKTQQELINFLSFVESHNPREYLYLEDVPMSVYIGTEGYNVVSATLAGIDSKVTMYKTNFLTAAS